ncbi:MAG: hypothetical protein BMS9Abin26_0848 [Gammaproteobacteria bacterium]|nr:MAG: hypothetical protein BMS9Abin26_0848 [Gammaproteobacteria bacterium]
MTNKRYKKSLIVLLSVVAVLWLVPMLVPMSSYVGEAEQQIGQLLQRKVSIDSLGFRLLPSIRLIASDIAITGKDDEGSLTVSQLEVFPDIVGLMSGDIRVQRLRLRGVQIPVKLMAGVIDEISATGVANASKQTASDGDNNFPLQALQIVDLHILIEPGKPLPGPYQLDADFTTDGLQQLVLSQRLKGNLEITLQKIATGYDIELLASQWTLPLGPAMMFDSLRAYGNITEAGLQLPEINGRLFAGSVTGRATAGWADGYQLDGRLVVKGVATDQVMALFSQDRIISAALSGEVNYSLAATSPDKLAASLKADGNFLLGNAIIHAVGKGLQIPRLQAQLKVASSQLKLSRIHGELYDGSLKGKGFKLNWADKMRASGDINVSKLNAEKLLAVFQDDKLFSGRLNGNAKYSLTSSSVEKALDRYRANGRFSFSDGVIYNLDLAKGASSLSADAMKGGRTAYETFTGDFVVVNRGIDLTNLDLESGVLKTVGEVHSDKQEQLSGNIEISLKDSMSIAAIDVALQGSISEPDFSLATGRNIGTAAGAAVAGPAGAAAGGTVGKTLEGAWKDIKKFFSDDGNENRSGSKPAGNDDEEENDTYQ